MGRFEQKLKSSPLFPMARNVYRRLMKRRDTRAAAEMGIFYSQFFSPGDTIFDVGANQGEYAEFLSQRGARVIAIEPNPAFGPRLMALASINEIVPVMRAVGAETGTATLNVCSTAGYSTLLSPDSGWIADSPDYATVEWTESVTVPVCTLDEVAAEFGRPVFVKIDVEGFELEVLRGMSFNPLTLSFEYGPRRKDLGYACIEHLGNRGYEFRPIVGREVKFVTNRWFSAEEAAGWLSDFTPDVAEYGDMFCRRRT